MSTGTINVQTENIFPIIKQFLYSDNEIFLRELVSNAVDASQKLKTLASIGEFKGDLGELKVEVELDKEGRKITIRDRGVGMTAEEIDKYINQIAFSGAEEFVNKYKDKSEGIIGHFGLGFYSAFMVASNVEIISLSHQKGAKAVKWSCDGSPNYTIEDAEKEDRGTEIILHVAEDADEFLEEARLSTILTKYCKFLPIPIFFGEESKWIEDPSGEKDENDQVKQIEEKHPRQINSTDPLWSKSPANLEAKDYDSFYKDLYPFSEDPLFNIHLNVDYPFNLTGILYFPKLKNQIEIQKNKIQLYSNQVFITDSVEEIVPDFLTLLHGVIDSPDIPLNVSRSYLQSDGNVKKISNHIMKKVADKLEEMFKTDREDFESKWDAIKVFIEYGMLTEDKFYDRAKKFVLFKNTDGKYQTIEELKENLKDTQTNKQDKLVLLYTSNEEEQHAFIDSAKNKSYEVLILDSPLTPHFVSKVEQAETTLSFARVDSDAIEKLIEKDEEIPSKLTKEDEEKLRPLFEEVVGKEKFAVQFESRYENEAPIIITQSEFIRRMNEQQKMSGGNGGMFGAMPEMYSLVVNSNHPIISEIKDTKTEKKRQKLSKQLVDLALLSQGMLKGKELTEFINRSLELIK